MSGAVCVQRSMCLCPLHELSAAGASGSVFYASDDDEFIIKTVQKREAEFLLKLLPGYFLVRASLPPHLSPSPLSLSLSHTLSLSPCLSVSLSLSLSLSVFFKWSRVAFTFLPEHLNQWLHTKHSPVPPSMYNCTCTSVPQACPSASRWFKDFLLTLEIRRETRD